ncbi:putative polyketide cyclase/dehydrase, START-like domain superfamily [Dioscorea sansibarensis]
MEKKEEEKQKENKETWQRSVTAKVRRGTRNQVWSLVGDYLSLDKWLPNISTCSLVEGVPGQPGCVRYCSMAPPTDIDGETAPNVWVNERLLTLDPIGHSLSYDITENNMGFTRYVATLKVVGGGDDDDDDDDEDGCSLEWSFEADPVDGLSEENLVSYLQDGLDAMAAKVEDVLHA